MVSSAKGEDGYFVTRLDSRGLVSVGRTYERATGQAPTCTTPSALNGQAPAASNRQARAARPEGRWLLYGPEPASLHMGKRPHYIRACMHGLRAVGHRDSLDGHAPAT